MTLYKDTPVYPQSLACDGSDNLRCTDEMGYGPRMGIDILTRASLEFAKVWLAELSSRRDATESLEQLHVEASVRGWEMAEMWVAAADRKRAQPSGNPG